MASTETVKNGKTDSKKRGRAPAPEAPAFPVNANEALAAAARALAAKETKASKVVDLDAYFGRVSRAITVAASQGKSQASAALPVRTKSRLADITMKLGELGYQVSVTQDGLGKDRLLISFGAQS